MARDVTYHFKTDKRFKKTGSPVSLIMQFIPKYVYAGVQKYLEKDLSVAMRQYAQDNFKDGVFHQNGVLALKNFKVDPVNRNKITFTNVIPYSAFLVYGRAKRGPVYVGSWVRELYKKGKLDKGSSLVTTREDGSKRISEFTYVGGNNSRIKLHNSERDFMRPVVDEQFSSGKADKLIAAYMADIMTKKKSEVEAQK